MEEDELDTLGQVVGAGLLEWESRALYQDIAAGRTTAPGPSPALDQLLDLQLVSPDAGRPGHYVALSPADVALRLQQHFLQLGTQHLAQAAAMPRLFDPMITAYRAANPGNDGALEYVASKVEMQERLGPIIESCREELLTAQPGGARPPNMLAMSYQRDIAVIERGATLRSIYQASARRDGPTASWAATMTGYGAQVRTLGGDIEFGRTVIVDQRVAVIATPDPERALLIRDEALVRHIRLSWLRDWGMALDWDGRPLPEVTSMQRDILSQLAQDVTLESIAASHGVSRRWISMRLEPLKDATGATSLHGLLYWWARHASHYLEPVNLTK
ncbi:hypothetical protein ACIQOW_08330 [Kitasatospora sp. NPDC091335]|uniref:hypothetical protein n=1 Tax=Kitasatospora sp. NPDC091335 TaxID=3364085 RepID=UPI00380A1813